MAASGNGARRGTHGNFILQMTAGELFVTFIPDDGPQPWLPFCCVDCWKPRLTELARINFNPLTPEDEQCFAPGTFDTIRAWSVGLLDPRANAADYGSKRVSADVLDDWCD